MVRQLSVNIFTNFITSTAMAEAFITHPIFELIISYLIKSSDVAMPLDRTSDNKHIFVSNLSLLS